MIINGKHKAWFYPSKGLNELFYRAGKLPVSNTKAATPFQKANPKPKTPSTTTSKAQRRRSYVEVLKMAYGGDNGKRLGGTWKKDRVVELMTRISMPRPMAVAPRGGVPPSLLATTIRGMNEADRMAAMCGAGKGAPTEDTGTRACVSTVALDEEVVIKRGQNASHVHGARPTVQIQIPAGGETSRRGASDSQGQVDFRAQKTWRAGAVPQVPEVFKNEKAGKAKVDEGRSRE
jgi:hypothetical protein